MHLVLQLHYCNATFLDSLVPWFTAAWVICRFFLGGGVELLSLYYIGYGEEKANGGNVE